jgi:hypothetical protein
VINFGEDTVRATLPTADLAAPDLAYADADDAALDADGDLSMAVDAVTVLRE